MSREQQPHIIRQVVILGGLSILLGTVLVIIAAGTLYLTGYRFDIFFPAIEGSAQERHGQGQVLAKTADHEEDNDHPIYLQYEDVSHYSAIVEQAWEDKEFDGLPLEIYNWALFQVVVVALEMMRQETPYEYSHVIDSTQKIRQAKQTRAYNGTTYIKPDDNYLSSVLWTAATLHHEATHHNQDESMDRVDKELEAIGDSIILMRELGAPEQIIDHLEQADGNHADIDGNGESTASDFFKMDW